MTVIRVLFTRIPPLDLANNLLEVGFVVYCVSSKRRGANRRIVLKPEVRCSKVRIVSFDTFLGLRMRWHTLASSKLEYIVFVSEFINDELELQEVSSPKNQLQAFVLKLAAADYEPIEDRPCIKHPRILGHMKAQHKVSMIQKIGMKLYAIRLKEDRDRMRKEIMQYLAGKLKAPPTCVLDYPPIRSMLQKPEIKVLRQAVMLAYKVGPDDASAKTGIDRFDLAYIMAANKK